MKIENIKLTVHLWFPAQLATLSRQHQYINTGSPVKNYEPANATCTHHFNMQQIHEQKVSK